MNDVQHELNMAIAKTVSELMPGAVVSLVRNMRGDERVLFHDADSAWVVAVDQLVLP